jgi:hypothetical protein
MNLPALFAGPTPFGVEGPRTAVLATFIARLSGQGKISLPARGDSVFALPVFGSRPVKKRNGFEMNILTY